MSSTEETVEQTVEQIAEQIAEPAEDIGSSADDQETGWRPFVWLTAGLGTFALTASAAYRPSLDGPGEVLLAVMPLVVLVGISVVFLEHVIKPPSIVTLGASILALVGWTVLVFDDDRWSILTVALYAVCFSVGRVKGIVLAAILSVAWAAAYLLDDGPIWTVALPTGVFLVGSLISTTLHRAEEENSEQADLIRQLQTAQRDLAASERSKGMLEERARFAAEIHDTLAQGFTSIVLLSRAAQRNGRRAEGLAAIEETAQENLEAARRLVDAVRPPELDAASLPDALDRQINGALPTEIRSRFRVIGRPRQLTGAVEVTLLRAAQEALLNVRTHARAGNVDVTLSYLDDVVALDVRDDGIGFEPGSVSDRGSLTGGQGLQVLERRARSLSGELTIEAMEGGGAVVSVQLPATAR